MSPIGDIFRQGYPSLCINVDILSAFGDRAWLYPKTNRLAGRMAGVDHKKISALHEPKVKRCCCRLWCPFQRGRGLGSGSTGGWGRGPTGGRGLWAGG